MVQKQVFRIPQPDRVAAAKGDPARLALYESFHARLSNIERKIGAQGSDSDKQSPVAPAPPQAKMIVSFATGLFTIQITNPQDASTSNPTLANNQSRTPIQHELSCALNAAFSGQGDVRTFQLSPQTHFTIALTGRRWWRLRSTQDGKTFNGYVLKGPVGT